MTILIRYDALREKMLNLNEEMLAECYRCQFCLLLFVYLLVYIYVSVRLCLCLRLCETMLNLNEVMLARCYRCQFLLPADLLCQITSNLSLSINLMVG